MVRFARAQGSKSANARVPEEATSWSEMKQQLLESTSRKEDIEDSPTRIAKLTSSFYSPDKTKSFTDGGDWAEFETTDVSSENKKKKKNKYEKKEKASKDSLHLVHDDGKVKKKKKKEMKLDSCSVQQISNTEDSTEVKKKKKKELKLENDTVQHNITNTEDMTTEILSKSQKRRQKKKEKYGAKEPQEEQQSKKPVDNNQHTKSKKRRKPVQENRILIIDGRKIEIENFDNFPVMKEDADRMKELKKKMLTQNIPKDEVQRAMKLERRRAEKKLYREGRKLCFHCRKSGHLMSDCPELGQGTCTVCFKCGSTEHKSTQCQVTQGNDYKFGTCFVCGEQGHIARQCPDNPRGLYPQGGGCRVCGDVTHLKKDCPDLAEERKDNAITLSTADESLALEGLEEDTHQKEKPQTPRVNKIIKF